MSATEHCTEWELRPNPDLYKIPPYYGDSAHADIEATPIFQALKGRCPNCLGSGSFAYEGREWVCPNDDYGHVALRLFKCYCLANIPLQYQRERADWLLDAPVGTKVAEYLAAWEVNLLNGIGWDVYGEPTGVGKTSLAVALLKEIVKRGYAGWFTSFIDLTTLIDRDAATRDRLRQKLFTSSLVVIDDVLAPTSARQADFYEEKVEEIVRNRANQNLPTIITSNMEEPEFAKAYPRVYSVLSRVQHRVTLNGDDFRLGAAFERTFALASAGEVAPIN